MEKDKKALREAALERIKNGKWSTSDLMSAYDGIRGANTDEEEEEFKCLSEEEKKNKIIKDYLGFKNP